MHTNLDQSENIHLDQRETHHLQKRHPTKKQATLKTGKTVKETGIWFDSSGILGASPDGIVDDETVLEAKCPYTERNVTIEEALKSRTFCLKKVKVGGVMH